MNQTGALIQFVSTKKCGSIGFVTFMKTKMGRSSAKCFVVVVVDGFCGCSLERLFASEMEK